MKERCEYENCKKAASHCLVYYGNDQYGNRLPKPEEEVPVCFEHLVEVARSIETGLPTGI